MASLIHASEVSTASPEPAASPSGAFFFFFAALTPFSRRFRAKTHPEKHFGTGITSWFGREGGELDTL